MTRGVILILIAVVIGVVLIRTAVDGDTLEAGSGSTPETTAATVPDTSAPDDTTPADTTTPSDTVTDTTAAPTDTTAAPTDTTAAVDETTPTTAPGSFEPRAPSEVRVQVVNTTKVNGAAGRNTETFKELGYIVLKATNSTEGVLAVTKIHHESGYLLEAQEVARELGLDPNDNVFAMPDAPEANITDYENPHVLVLVGADIAG